MSALQTLAKPHRIKASHRRRGKVASGPIVQRYYDPTIGRFLSVDPVTANSVTGSNFNRYWYANNNPYKFTDPDGRIPLVIPLVIEGCAASVVCGAAAIATGAYIGKKIGDLINFVRGQRSESGDIPTGASGDKAPSLPTGLVGEEARDTSKYGGTAKGTSLPAGKFPEVVNDLTGGTLGKPDEKGRSTSPNGVSVRTGGRDGPRIEVPANGTKPVEIIHFPKDTPVPENLKPRL